MEARPLEHLEDEYLFEHRWMKADFLFGLERWKEAAELYEQLVEEFGGEPQFPPDIVTSLAYEAVRIGEGERARELSVDLAGRIEETQRAGWDIEGRAVAYLLVGRARIAASLGEREEAVQLLREGFRRTRHKGAYVSLAHRLPEFKSLHDYLPYQQFLKPRG